MGLLFGYPEEVSTSAPFVTTKYLTPIDENNRENIDPLGEYKQLPSAPRCKVENIWSGLFGDISRNSQSESDSPPPQKRLKKSRSQIGQTRGRDQNLEYLDGDQWVPAVYHHNIRAFLIEKASRNGSYTYPRERGPDNYDVTSFLESQKDWGPVRNENWADILYVFQKKKGHKDPAYKLKEWKFNGKLVISAYDNQPILKFRDMPDTLSSALHGRDMEAMKRTDPRIRQRDIMARMPPRHTNQAGTRRIVLSTSSIGMRMTRFREQEGVSTWVGRDGSQKIREALWERLPPENKLANSIRGLQAPTVAEQNKMKKLNAGHFLNRSGKRALGPRERLRRRKIVERRLGVQQDGESPDGGGVFLDDGDAGTSGTPTKNDINVHADLAESNAEEGNHHSRHGEVDNLSMQPPSPSPPTNMPPTYQDDIANSPAPTMGSNNNGDSSRGFSLAPPRGFDVESFLADLLAEGSNPSGTNDISSSLPEGCDFDPLFLGPPPEGGSNNGDYPSHQSNHSSLRGGDGNSNNSLTGEGARAGGSNNDEGNSPSRGSNQSSPPGGGWNFDYSLPGSNASSADGGEGKSLSPKDYPQPPDDNINSSRAEESFDGANNQQQSPYQVQPPEQLPISG